MAWTLRDPPSSGFWDCISINTIGALKGLGLPWNSMKYRGILYKNLYNRSPQGSGSTLEYLPLRATYDKGINNASARLRIDKVQITAFIC